MLHFIDAPGSTFKWKPHILGPVSFYTILTRKKTRTGNGHFQKARLRFAGTLRLRLPPPGEVADVERSRSRNHIACIPKNCTRLIPMCSMMLAGSRMSLGNMRSVPAFTQAQVEGALGRFLL